MNSSVGQILRQAAKRHPNKVAVIAYDSETSSQSLANATYDMLDTQASHIASALLNHGVQPGDTIALMAENSIDFIQCWFGIVYAGAVVVPVSILSAGPEIELRLVHAQCKALITDTKRTPIAQQVPAIQNPGFLCTSIEQLKSNVQGSTFDSSWPLPRSPQSPALLMYTSGTTGAAKGAQILHSSLLTHTASLVHHTLKFTEHDKIFAALPMTHSFGLRMALLAPFYAGATVVLVPRFFAQHSFDIIRHEKITWLPVVPTMLSRWCELFSDDSISNEEEKLSRKKLSSLRWCLSAGAALPQEIQNRASQILGTEVRQGFGLTEASFSTIDAPPHRPLPSCVGKPVWGVDIRIVDEAMSPMPPHKVGLIFIQGINVMDRYLHDETATDTTIIDGWLNTGDLGYLDEEGRLFVVGRKKELIIHGGHNVYPSEVEQVIAQHPEVKEVAVFGLPDPHYGEQVAAVVSLHNPQKHQANQSLLKLLPDSSHTPNMYGRFDKWCRKQLAAYKVPRAYFIVPNMPLGPSGKILKRQLQEEIHTQQTTS